MADRICLIIVNWHCDGYLHRCLAAVLRQTVLPAEIIVIDNASDNFSLMAFQSAYPHVTFIKLKNNLGFAAANNIGIKQCPQDCKWICLLNPDAFPAAHCLENLLTAATSHPEYDFFGTRMMRADSAGVVDGIGDVYHSSGLAWRDRHGHAMLPDDGKVREIFSPCAAAALYRADLLYKYGGFDEDYFCYAEDVDIGFRLRLMGHRCLYVPDAVVHHVGSASTGRQSDFSIYHGHRNLVWTFVKNMPWSLLVYYLPQHVLLNVFSLLWFTLRGKGPAIFQAKKDAIFGLGRAWAKRKQAVANRRISAASLRQMFRRGLIIKR